MRSFPGLALRVARRALSLERLEGRVLPAFVAPPAFDVGTQPAGVAVADLNGDGIPDLITTNSNGNDVSVLLGHGDGSFQPARNFPVGLFPTSLVVGDFNGDGIPDLAVTSGTVHVLLGNGDGSFRTSSVSYIAGGDPEFVEAHLGGAGRDDLVTANTVSNDVSVLLNDGVWGGGLAPGGQPSHRPRSGVAVSSLSAGLPGVPGDFGSTVPRTPAASSEAAGPESVPPPAAEREASWTVTLLSRLEHHMLQRRLLSSAEETLPEDGLTDLPR
jgi:hypothetical protein